MSFCNLNAFWLLHFIIMEEQKNTTDEKKDEDKKDNSSKPSTDNHNDADKKTENQANQKDDEIEIPKKFEKIVSEIEKMNVLDLSELVKILEKKFNVSSAAPVMMGAMPSATGAQTNGGGESEEEKTIFDIELSDAGSNKIAIIKIVKQITDLGLREAKDLVDGAPQVIKKAVKKEEAEEIKKKIEEAGGKVVLK